MTAFEKAFANIVDIEKGYVNNPSDNGGETKFGVSKNAYPDEDIPNLTLERAKLLFKRDYWDKVAGDSLPPALAEFLFDYAINSGVSRAAKALQKAVGALPDGAVGVKTVAAIGRVPPLHIARLVFVDRAKLMARHEDFEAFCNGWFARLFDVTVRFVNDGGR